MLKNNLTNEELLEELEKLQIENELLKESYERELAKFRQTELVLRESNEHKEALLKANPDMMFLIDKNGVFLDYKGGAGAQLIIPYDQFIGKKISEVLPPHIADLANTHLSRVFETQQTQIYQYQLEISNEVLFFENRMVLCGESKVLSLAHDITNRKTAQNLLEMGEKRLRTIINVSPVPMALNDEQGNITFLNPSFIKTYGYELNEISTLSQWWVKAYPDKEYRQFVETKWLERLKEAKQNGEYFTPMEIDIQCKNGSTKTVIASAAALSDSFKGEHLVVLHDITEKRKMIDDLVKANELALQSNRLKDAFIANMSHEIRTPLNGILGMTSVIKEIYAANITGKEEKYFAAVDKSGQRILRTIDMVLNYSSLQVGAYNIKKEEFDLSSICNVLFAEYKPIATERSLNFSFVNKVGKIFIYADKNSISQSISGLVDNAIKFTKSGFIKIELLIDKNDEIVISVKDSGIGISDEYLARIFEPYSQEQVGYGRAYEGVGLGLAIVKRILDLNDSTISVISKKGEGTIFTINFEKALVTFKNIPYIKPAITKIDVPEYPQNLVEKNKPVVLLVEDDKVNVMLISEIIEERFDVLSTESSDEVVDILNSNKIDVILMDISIKGTKNGLELATELKTMKKFASIPIIAVTAHATLKDRINSLAAGCDDYLKKPFTQKELRDKIESFVFK